MREHKIQGILSKLLTLNINSTHNLIYKRRYSFAGIYFNEFNHKATNGVYEIKDGILGVIVENVELIDSNIEKSKGWMKVFRSILIGLLLRLYISWPNFLLD